MTNTPKLPIEVQCDEDGETFICLETRDRRKALKHIRNFMDHECGVDPEYLPKLDDLELMPIHYGLNEDVGEDWYWWGNPPKNAKFIGAFYGYKI